MPYKSRDDRIAYAREYRRNHKDYFDTYNKSYYDEHRDEILDQKKEYQQENRKEIYQKRKEYLIEWQSRNKDKCRERAKKSYHKNKDKNKMKIKLHNIERRAKSKFFALNEPFEGYEAHHLTKDIVAFIPHDIHRSIYHNLQTGEGMPEINGQVLIWAGGI